MKCPNCGNRRHNWLGGNSFECADPACGFFFEDKVHGTTYQHSEKYKYEEKIRCPQCIELTEGVGDNLEHLEDIHTYFDGFEYKSGYFHPDCWTEFQRHQRFLEIAEEKQLGLLEKVSQVPCPHCGAQEICLNPGDGYPYILRPYWECMNCNEEINKHWLFQEIKKNETTALHYKPPP